VFIVLTFEKRKKKKEPKTLITKKICVCVCVFVLRGWKTIVIFYSFIMGVKKFTLRAFKGSELSWDVPIKRLIAIKKF
jgi:hypothetical protein